MTSAASGSPTTATTRPRWPPSRCAGARASTAARTTSPSIDPDLRLIHLHRMDYGICLRTPCTRSGAAGTSSTSAARGRGTTGSPTRQEFDRWFYEDSCFEVDPDRARGGAAVVATASSEPAAQARDGCCCPRRAAGRAVAAGGAQRGGGPPPRDAGPRAARRRRRSAAPTTPPSRGSATRASTSPSSTSCAPLGGPRPLRRGDLRAGDRARGDPVAAARNLRALCRPGGHVIVSTPFLIRVHELPAYGMKDYWRFTPRGLRTLLEARRAWRWTRSARGATAAVVTGNLYRWPAYRRWLPLRNEPDLPVQVWAFARNPRLASAARARPPPGPADRGGSGAAGSAGRSARARKPAGGSVVGARRRGWSSGIEAPGPGAPSPARRQRRRRSTSIRSPGPKLARPPRAPPGAGARSRSSRPPASAIRSWLVRPLRTRISVPARRHDAPAALLARHVASQQAARRWARAGRSGGSRAGARAPSRASRRPATTWASAERSKLPPIEDHATASRSTATASARPRRRRPRGRGRAGSACSATAPAAAPGRLT